MNISDDARALSGLPGRLEPVRALGGPRRTRADWQDALDRLSPPAYMGDIHDALARLDGTLLADVALLSGLTPDEINELGGVGEP